MRAWLWSCRFSRASVIAGAARCFWFWCGGRGWSCCEGIEGANQGGGEEDERRKERPRGGRGLAMVNLRWRGFKPKRPAVVRLDGSGGAEWMEEKRSCGDDGELRIA